MHAVILAGGKGTRLLPLTEEIPKPLVPIGGVPIIELLLKCLKRGGVKSAHLAIGHRAEQIRSLLGGGDRFGLEIKYSQEATPLSTVAPLKKIASLPERFLVEGPTMILWLNFVGRILS